MFHKHISINSFMIINKYQSLISFHCEPDRLILILNLHLIQDSRTMEKITFLHCSTVRAALYLHHFLRLRRSAMLSSGFFVARCELSFFFFISLVIVDRLTWGASVVVFRSEAISAMLMFGLRLASIIALFSSLSDIFLGRLEQLLSSTIPNSL